ncbi:MAG: HupE/UreJ family protein, partial [Acidobacteria bacterium]|nr:HupE/UreJ family protein [Acidobacteriota bacterium]
PRIDYFRLFRVLAFIWVFMVVVVLSTFAHDPGLSSVELKLGAEQSLVKLTFAREEIAGIVPIDTNQDSQITQTEFDSARAQLEQLARQAIVINLDGSDLQPTKVSASLGDSNALHIDLLYSALTEGQIMISAPLIGKLARGHRQFLTLHDQSGRKLSEKLLDANNNQFESRMDSLFSPVDWPTTFGQFFWLGVEHILLGFDHLAFLFALLIVGSTLTEAAKIITSFTVAHSITLGLATFNVVNLPSGIVEPLIALSIIYVGIENLFRREVKKRWLLTFAFGLVHGFGFASVLREMGIGSYGNATTPLLSFNLGVEIGQIAIAALILPLIWKFKSQPTFARRFAPICSLLIAVAGGYWLIERTLFN